MGSILTSPSLSLIHIYLVHDSGGYSGGIFSCFRGDVPVSYTHLDVYKRKGYDIDLTTGEGRVVDMRGLHGYNCRHGHMLFDKRMRNPWRDAEGNLLDGSGNKITDAENLKRYEDSQKQRSMERGIRKTTRQLIVNQEELAWASGAEREKLQKDYDKLAYRLQGQNRAYNQYCEEHGLQPQYNRNALAGFGYPQQKAANKGAKRYAENLSLIHICVLSGTKIAW